jgi:hypothetical protein
MSQRAATTIRLKALDGTWETCGVDRLRGIVPSNVQTAIDEWGPSSASFELRRDPRQSWPDIGAFTDVEIEEGGVVVWDGRVKETPARDGSDRLMQVNCEGWQNHLDDDLYLPFYVHNNLGDWRDSRSFPNMNLTDFKASGLVRSGDGALDIGWAAGAVVTAAQGVAVTLDLGPGVGARFVAADCGLIGSNAGWSFYGIGHDEPTGVAGFGLTGREDAWSGGTPNTGTYTGAFSIPHRYVTLLAYSNTLAGTIAADTFLRIWGIRVFASSTYQSSGASVLKAPTVIKDALTKATALLSADRSEIDPNNTIAFNIPASAPRALKTPREMWDAVDAYHDYVKQIRVGRVPVYKPKPTVAALEVGAWSPMEFEDQSANSGAEIYNRVAVTGQAPDATPVIVDRLADAYPDYAMGQPSNPSADTNAASWTGTGSTTVTRDTSTFDSAPASLKLSGVTVVEATSDLISFSLTAGYLYALNLAMRADAAQNILQISVRDAAGTVVYGSTALIAAGTGWVPVEMQWQQPVSTTGFVVRIYSALPGSAAPRAMVLNADTIKIGRLSQTLVSRRGFRRTKELRVQSTLPSDGVAATQIGDTWLAGHTTTPFKGTVKITGDTAVRDVYTGQDVPAYMLLLKGSEMLRFSDRVDPDTGAVGRDGRIVAVAFDHTSRAATITLDETRSGVEALLERLAVVTGGS